jgi:hypothetical protein
MRVAVTSAGVRVDSLTPFIAEVAVFLKALTEDPRSSPSNIFMGVPFRQKK